VTETGLVKVALAIAAYRSDEQVIGLLRRAFADGHGGFGAVIVVDSLGSGAIAQAISAEGWPVQYINAESNLGSAGNLSLRLLTAAGTGLKWCLALNHDAELDWEKAAELVRYGEGAPEIGAVYPQLRLTQAGGRLDAPRKDFAPFGKASDIAANTDVAWGSSNGALYRLDPMRGGLDTWPELWMGYEDLAIGWELASRGWRQILCGNVIVDDNYEHRSVRFLGKRLEIVEKPAWYSYYQLRNLALIRRKTGGKALGGNALARRAARDLALLLFKDNKRKRLELLLEGLSDGLRGRTGKGPVP
jgi:GT2 family glycosyltransferase